MLFLAGGIQAPKLQTSHAAGYEGILGGSPTENPDACFGKPGPESGLGFSISEVLFLKDTGESSKTVLCAQVSEKQRRATGKGGGENRHRSLAYA